MAHVKTPHDDVVVIMVDVEVFDMRKMFVDRGTLMDIMILEAFEKLGRM